jgi:hypothetical protein
VATAATFRRTLRLLLLVSALLTASVAGTAKAGLIGTLLPSCGSTSQVFAPWGDNDQYFGFTNNGFENGTSGWTVSGAAVAKGNEPWHVNGAGSSSLAIGPGGSASSPLVCTALDAPHWRMFALAGAANGPLHARIVFYGLTGNITGILNFNDVSPSSFGSWAPSPFVSSALALPLLTKYAQLQLTSGATSGTWQIDDVYVDPWRAS